MKMKIVTEIRYLTRVLNGSNVKLSSAFYEIHRKEYVPEVLNVQMNEVKIGLFLCEISLKSEKIELHRRKT